jgi:sigma-E factor negative regulatory protein RseA
MNVDLSTRERLSSFMDGNANDEFTSRGTDSFVNRLLNEDGLQATWSRYHLIGDCMRSGTPAYDADLTAAISQRIQQEPTILAPRATSKPAQARPREHSWITGAAIAAGVAALVVIGVPQLNNTSPDGSGQLAEINSVPAQGAVQPVALSLQGEKDRSTPRHEPAISSKLDRYLANHSDFAADGSLNGMVPLATFINYYE